MGGPRACGAAHDAALRHEMLVFFSGDVRCARSGDELVHFAVARYDDS